MGLGQNSGSPSTSTVRVLEQRIELVYQTLGLLNFRRLPHQCASLGTLSVVCLILTGHWLPASACVAPVAPTLHACVSTPLGFTIGDNGLRQDRPETNEDFNVYEHSGVPGAVSTKLSYKYGHIFQHPGANQNPRENDDYIFVWRPGQATWRMKASC
jgi:hypothetical protein